MRRVRGREIALVSQSPLSSLNPALSIGAHFTEAWKAHCETSPGDWRELLRMVSLPDEESFLKKYPRELSVGLAQRVLIAMGIIHRPPLLLADEPTSALDLITQSEILQLFTRLNRELRTAVLYISHDLASVASLCHRVAILHQGRIVECAPTQEIFRNPSHSYTCDLIRAAPLAPSYGEHVADLRILGAPYH